ncbi:MAG: hypothetical protein ACLFOY_11155 [Desulfatibacillaceae bacterium]
MIEGLQWLETWARERWPAFDFAWRATLYVWYRFTPENRADTAWAAGFFALMFCTMARDRAEEVVRRAGPPEKPGYLGDPETYDFTFEQVDLSKPPPDRARKPGRETRP